MRCTDKEKRSFHRDSVMSHFDFSLCCIYYFCRLETDRENILSKAKLQPATN